MPPLPVFENEQITSHDPDQSRFTRQYTDRAVAFIERNRERPFFVYFPHYAVHTPLAGKPEVIAKYQKKLAAGTYTQTNAI